MTILTYERFARYVRSALHYLYDPDQLRRSPLAQLFAVGERFDTPSALQRILTRSIEDLKPDDGELQSRAWRIYDALVYRYVRRLDREAVADQLGISTRQLQRELRAAIEALADALWTQYHLKGMASPEAQPASDPEHAGSVTGELAWLRDAPPETTSDLEHLLETVLGLVRPLARQWDVILHTTIADDLPRLALRPVALHHALLSLLTRAISQARGGHVCLSAAVRGSEVELSVEGRSGLDRATPSPDDGKADLDVARQLADLCGGRLTLNDERGASRATLVLPALEQVQVLLIDDNADFLQLLQRYASGSRYTIVGVREPARALSLAERILPRVIILDVMMPGVDGWAMLAELRQHPLTGPLPIIICSILPQEALACPLGASAFLRKPVTRQELLRVLDEQVQAHPLQGGP